MAANSNVKTAAEAIADVGAAAKPALEDAVRDVSSAARAQLDTTLNDLADRAERIAQDTLTSLRERAKPYVGDASEHIATAERYLTERVQKQPLTTTLAVLGVGVLVGMVLAGGRNR